MKEMSGQIDIKEHMNGMSHQTDKKNTWKKWVVNRYKRKHERNEWSNRYKRTHERDEWSNQ